jgi:hypothetical protein
VAWDQVTTREQDTLTSVSPGTKMQILLHILGPGCPLRGCKDRGQFSPPKVIRAVAQRLRWQKASANLAAEVSADRTLSELGHSAQPLPNPDQAPDSHALRSGVMQRL